MTQEAATLKAIQNWLEMKGILYVRVNPPGSYAKKLAQPKLIWTKKGMKKISWEYGFKKIRASQKGAPDLIVFFPISASRSLLQKTVAIEVKSTDGELRPEQKAWREKAEKVNLPYYVVKSFGEFLGILTFKI